MSSGKGNPGSGIEKFNNEIEKYKKTYAGDAIAYIDLKADELKRSTHRKQSIDQRNNRPYISR